MFMYNYEVADIILLSTNPNLSTHHPLSAQK